MEYAEEGLCERDVFLRTQVKSKKPNERDNMLKIIFSLDTGKVKFEHFKTTEARRRDYLWIGNNPGVKTQTRLTASDSKYIVDNFLARRSKWAIEGAVKKIEKGKLDEDADVRWLKDVLIAIKRQFFSSDADARRVVQLVENYIKSRKDVALFTVSVEKDGKEIDLVKNNGYKKFIEAELLSVRRVKRGVCHVCGEEKDVTPDPSYPLSILKVYSIDKKGFTSGIEDTDEARIRTHAVCLDCLRKLHAGAMFVRNKLRVNIGGLNAYLIPKSPFEEINPWMVEFMSKSFRTINNLDHMAKPDEILKEYVEHKGKEGMCYLDLIFGREEQATFNFKSLVPEVPLLRLTEIRDECREWISILKKFFGGTDKTWDLSFTGIRMIFPLRRRGRDIVEWKPLVTLYSSMLKGNIYPLNMMFTKALTLMRIHRYNTYNLYSLFWRYKRKNVAVSSERDKWLCRDLIKFNAFLKLLEQLKVIRTEDKCNTMSSNVFNEKELPDDIKEWFKIANYNDGQKALFLLGTLVAKIGTEQFKKGDKKKAVLNKIDFDGMSVERVMILANQVLKSFRDYRILGENEKLYGQMKMLLDANLSKLNDHLKNVFYVMSGYAFSTYRALTRGGESGGP